MDTSPLRWTTDPVSILTPSPWIGEHNEYVLREVLGLSNADLVELIINEVV